MTNLFAQGNAAVTFTGSWFADQVESSGASFRVGVFPLPDAPGATHSTANLDGILAGVNGLAASAKAADRNPPGDEARWAQMGPRDGPLRDPRRRERGVAVSRPVDADRRDEDEG